MATPLRVCALLLACLALLLAGCGSDDDPAGGGSAAATATAEPDAEATPTPEDTGGEQVTGCRPVEAPPAKDVPALDAPEEELDPAKTYVATVATNCGEFQITLDAERAPITGGAFKSLADGGFFDGLLFHRVVPGFVIQGGDPAGDGTGGPGFSTEEAPPADLTYDKGVVAMAKTPDEPAGTAGSQFFVVTGETTPLTPDYALLGKVTSGQEVVDTIGVVPVGPGDAPVDPVVISRLTVAEAG